MISRGDYKSGLINVARAQYTLYQTYYMKNFPTNWHIKPYDNKAI